ncbi:hypothetical protein RO3G_09560 [Rhizopus delemar RA 99-880]|uniref:NodB homology domain-containing protein n=1 Tax=Rhizopus delemar (strain RA 99-880 / ATCC MYA-4621 / FGSC 9543 / NRRL 43880) TaxID=246409 RepID=I1C8S0_RHIO9|nr:hypothetical protein RO3G_09560 [Rhizopus delemar RA 99-880]|eukprot:EIE84850.1 hypothetical protein RO3G_09560 [Rhizopus delemar RA 99-880]
MLITNSVLLLAAGAVQVYAATSTSSNYLPQFSPSFPKIKKASGVVSSYNAGPYDTSSKLSTETLKGYPEPWSSPDTSHPEIKAVYKKINWSKVPKAPVRKQKSNGDWEFDSDGDDDPYCWWSDTNCVKPKASYLPPDIYECPKKGDWGLTYDDGPFNKLDADAEGASKENPYAEPALYNFLAKRNLHANLFYIGSNVVTYPAAAKRALNNGHQLCVHTWSHPVMTTQSNIKVVAELYWTLKAIKEATGVTPKCWRPPQGDVDDRVRSIAWQMGLRTVLWNEDSNDWNMPDNDNGGTLSPKKVDGYFQSWINAEKAGKFKTGLVVLEHELNRKTVNMTMHWLPTLEKTFNVVPALSCPTCTDDCISGKCNGPVNPKPKPNTSCTSGSYGLEKGDGYSGYCCKTQADCQDDCVSGKCNGPTAPSSSCKPGSRGKRKGDGKDGYCCSSSDDCLETCRSGKCGL